MARASSAAQVHGGLKKGAAGAVTASAVALAGAAIVYGFLYLIERYWL